MECSSLKLFLAFIKFTEIFRNMNATSFAKSIFEKVGQTVIPPNLEVPYSSLVYMLCLATPERCPNIQTDTQIHPATHMG